MVLFKVERQSPLYSFDMIFGETAKQHINEYLLATLLYKQHHNKSCVVFNHERQSQYDIIN